MTDVGDDLDDGSGARVSGISGVASPAGSDICDSAFSVADSVMVASGATVKVCIDVALEVGKSQADSVVEASCCCSLDEVSVG